MYRHCLDCNKDIYEDTDFCPDCGGYLVIENKSIGEAYLEKYGCSKYVKKSHRNLFSMMFGGIKAYSRLFVYPFLLAFLLSLSVYQHNPQVGLLNCIEVFFATMWILSCIFSYRTYNEYAFHSEFTNLCFLICLVCNFLSLFFC